MSWSSTTLTTSATLARHEKEISLQAGSTARWAVYVPPGETVWFSTLNTTIATALVTYSDATTATLTAADDKVILPTAKYIIGIATYSAAAALLNTFQLDEGYGATLTDTTGLVTLTLLDVDGNWTGWIETATYGDYSWQDKIGLAKEIIGHRIETKLVEYGVAVDEAGGEVLLDTLTNAQTFDIASDYLTLSLIYLDLQAGGFNELFQNKHELYSARYEAELAEAFSRMNLDPSLSGSTTDYRVEILGRVTR
jgi:hypothetical protein